MTLSQPKQNCPKQLLSLTYKKTCLQSRRQRIEEQKAKSKGPSNIAELERLEGEARDKREKDPELEHMLETHTDSDSDGGLEKQIKATEKKIEQAIPHKTLLETTYWEVIRRHPTYFPHRRGCHIEFSSSFS